MAAKASITGGGGADVIDGGTESDTITGGGGSDSIDVGNADDDVEDRVVFTETTDGADTVTDFDNTGTEDVVRLGGNLNTLLDDVANNNNIAWATDNNTNNDNVAVNLNTVAEALFLDGLNSEGVANADLSNATNVASEFSAEFNITASSGGSVLLVVNATDSNSSAIWIYTEDGTTSEIQATELTLLAVIVGNADITMGRFDFI